MTVVLCVGPPSQPAGIYAEKATATTAIVHWSEGGDNGQPITSYAIHAHNLAEDFWAMVKTSKTTLSTGLWDLLKQLLFLKNMVDLSRP